MSSRRSAVLLLEVLAFAAACGGRAQQEDRGGAAAAAGSPNSAVSGSGGASDGDAPAPDHGGRSGDASSDRGGGGAASAQGGASPVIDAGAGGVASNAGAVGASGESGAGGSADACSRTTWTASASANCAPPGGYCPGWSPPGPQTPAEAIDDDLTTRYTSGVPQQGNEEFTVTFPASVSISGIELTAPYELDTTGAYALEYSTDGTVFVPFAPPLVGPGLGEPSEARRYVLTVPFAATVMRAVKIKQTAATGGWWSILEFKVIGCTSG